MLQNARPTNNLELILMPAKIGVATSVAVGRFAIERLSQSARVQRIGTSLLHLLDTQSFVAHRTANHLAHRKDQAIQEIADRPDDFELVDLNVLHFIALDREEDKQSEGVEVAPSEVYIRRAADILEDISELKRRTAEVSIEKVIELHEAEGLDVLFQRVETNPVQQPIA